MSAAIRQHFLKQADACSDLGSPFTQRLCAAIGRNLQADCAIGRRVLGWPGDGAADALALRLCGALHALVRSGIAASLAALYPPHACLDEETLWHAVRKALNDHEAAILAMLASPPQTNEVGRSAILLGGFLAIAQETGRSLDLLEIGSSCGLNLNWHRYGYRLGSSVWGDAASPVQLAPDWRGPLPRLDAAVQVDSATGCDRRPLDAGSVADCERLLAYIWPDQPERLARIDGALRLARRSGIHVEPLDAAAFVARELQRPQQGRVRVLFHTIVWQYLPAATKQAIAGEMKRAGETATADAPLAWLSFEADGRTPGAALTLRLWPGGQDRLLARADYHGRWVDWS